MINAMVNQIDETLLALAEPNRRRVVELLRAGPLRAGEIAVGLGMSRPATGRHLRVLREGGLVEVAMTIDDARGRAYQLRPDRFVALENWLNDVRSFWTDQLDSFKEHVERTGSEGPT